jgi:lipopolysaccharide transport system permease protein
MGCGWLRILRDITVGPRDAMRTETLDSDGSRVDLPLIRIRPSHGWAAFRLAELWNYRELIYFLTWRDIKVRYKQTVLGVLWALIQPLPWGAAV